MTLSPRFSKRFFCYDRRLGGLSAIYIQRPTRTKYLFDSYVPEEEAL
jgi:hypothetical protein